MVLYFDTSAVAKLVRTERETAALRSWLRRRGEQPYASSALLRVELLRAAAVAGPAAIERAEALLPAFSLITLGPRVLDRAGRLQPAELRSLDAIHVASALQIGTDLEALLTYDRRMIDACRSQGIEVAHPGVRRTP